jgi:hypothetical protein
MLCQHPRTHASNGRDQEMISSWTTLYPEVVREVVSALDIRN